MTGTKAWLDIFIGDRDAHESQQAAYDATDALLQKNRAIYGLPSSLAELSEEQQQILSERCTSSIPRFLVLGQFSLLTLDSAELPGATLHRPAPSLRGSPGV